VVRGGKLVHISGGGGQCARQDGLIMNQAELVKATLNRFGPKSVVTDPADIEPWLTDWRGRWHGKSAAILQPAATEDAAAMVVMAAKLGVALVPQGGNTSMVGGQLRPRMGRR
jgi:FAD/FMN-containing dehydrogenase